MHEANIIAAVERWLNQFVIGLNLCPFARRVAVQGGIRYKVTDASTEAQLSAALEDELNLLLSNPAIETTLLIHPQVLDEFYDYNDYLSVVEDMLQQSTFDGVFQVASFHPDYQFAGTHPDDAENYSNRTPYPLLHLLREDSVTAAVDSHADIDSIPVNNLQLLNRLDRDVLQQMWRSCLS
ncbi:MAG: DUF1415 domain-containing protein [bacterium]